VTYRLRVHGKLNSFGSFGLSLTTGSTKGLVDDACFDATAIVPDADNISGTVSATGDGAAVAASCVYQSDYSGTI
jgi:hypothetical protein